MQEFGTLAIAHNETRVKTGKHECSYSTMRFRKCTFSDDDTCNDDGYDWHVDMQVVDNPSAATLKCVARVRVAFRDDECVCVCVCV